MVANLAGLMVQQKAVWLAAKKGDLMVAYLVAYLVDSLVDLLDVQTAVPKADLKEHLLVVMKVSSKVA